MEKESQTEALWRRLLREGELVFIGNSIPAQMFIEEKSDETMVELFLTRRNSGDRKNLKLRICISIVKPPKPQTEDD
jgi:hypothetical protein